MLSQSLLEELKQYLENCQMRLYQERRVYQPICMPAARGDDLELDDYITRRRKPGFTQTLLQMIDLSGSKDSDIYSRAGLDRRHFSKIRSNPKYQPSKTTAIALALALELDRENADVLLAAAGFTLSESETFDLIIAWCMEKRVFDLIEVNQALDYFSQKTIGTTA